jgi:hypothetical protein
MRAAIVLCLAVVAACRTPPVKVVHYPHSTEEILNPERGFFVDIDLLNGRDYSYVRAQGYTLGYAGVRLDAWREQVLPPEVLEQLRAGFAAARDAGIKIILRFVYNGGWSGGDASLATVLAHIRQLKPVLHENGDVIAVMDAGFIGAWGEWHSSTHGLDNLNDRARILWAVLDALPPTRSATVRAPMYKRDMYGGPLEDGFDGGPASRIGHHNSCFLANDTDEGTYLEPIDTWKDYVAQDGRFTPVGGETCRPNPPRSDCATAIRELSRMHWSFLNAQYHPEVLKRWEVEGCRATIARDLGYRIELTSTTFDEEVAPGGVLSVQIRLVNTGYAAMYNARPVYITFDGARALTPIDPRRWEPGKQVTISARIRVPASAKPGPHTLGLWLPDADPRLQEPGRVELYSVRIANARWEAPLNVLSDEVIVDGAPVDASATELAWIP